MVDNGGKKKRRRGQKSSEKSGDEKENVASYQSHNSPFIQLDEDNPTWYEYGQKLPGRNDTISSQPPSPADRPVGSLVSKYRSIGDLIFQREIQLTTKGGSSKNSDERWVENTMKKGTLKDRIAAMSVTVSTDPVHKFYALEGLLSMVGCSESGGKTNSRVAQLAAGALEELFISTFLPSDRKLLTLAQRPLYKYEPTKNGQKCKKSLSPRILLLWRFEEMVKDKYELFLRKYLAQTLQDGAETHKIITLNSTAALLSSVPEGESQILAMMVNKLGDPAKKVAAAAAHKLRSVVLQEHPSMQIVVAREVQQLAHRPHLAPKALYNCVVFLNQLKLESEEESEVPEGSAKLETLPSSLIKTYFRLFEVAIKKDKNLNPDSEEAGMKGRLLSALLTGVNRAHPYLKGRDQDMEEHIDAIYRVVHTAAPAACTQALMLLFHLVVGSKLEDQAPDATPSETEIARQDRFYRALYGTLSKPALVSHGKHLTMYFNLLYKATKYDTDMNRVNAFAKRLMCTVLHSTPASMAGSLFLLNEIAKTHEGVRRCVEGIPDDKDAKLMIDETKREPKAAFSSSAGDDGKTLGQSYHPPSWELCLMSHHFHPSVAKFASTVGSIEYAGDPLKDFGLAPFLDKFAYRNPKSQEKMKSHYKRGESIAERRSGTDTIIQSRLQVPVNDPAFLEREDVEDQDQFFRKYFTERARRDEIKGISRNKKDEVDEEDDDNIEQAEDEALDAAEEMGGLDTGKTFEEYEQAWETDEEEEAFADSLAEQLIEDAADGEMEDLDDEDPDMDDWGDMYSDDEQETGKKTHAHGKLEAMEDEENSVDEDEAPGQNNDSDDDEDADAAGDQDEDAFMDANDSDGSDDGSDNEDSDDDEEDVDEDDIVAGLKDHLDEEEGDLALIEGDDDDSDDDDDDNDDDDSDEENKGKSRKKAKTMPTFMDAEEYFAQFSQGSQALTGKQTTKKNATSKAPTPSKTANSRRKRRKS